MSSLVIRGVTLIDGTGAPPVPDAVVVVEDGRFAAAGVGVPSQPDGAEVIDGSGLWAVPGLIDTHVHSELVGREALQFGNRAIRILRGDRGRSVHTLLVVRRASGRLVGVRR